MTKLVYFSVPERASLEPWSPQMFFTEPGGRNLYLLGARTKMLPDLAKWIPGVKRWSPRAPNFPSWSSLCVALPSPIFSSAGSPRPLWNPGIWPATGPYQSHILIQFFLMSASNPGLRLLMFMVSMLVYCTSTVSRYCSIKYHTCDAVSIKRN